MGDFFCSCWAVSLGIAVNCKVNERPFMRVSQLLTAHPEIWLFLLFNPDIFYYICPPFCKCCFHHRGDGIRQQGNGTVISSSIHIFLTF